MSEAMSEERHTSGAARPGGRTARTRAAVLAAVVDELSDSGYAKLSMEGVAQRSGVHLATIYRRWHDTEGLVVDLLMQMSGSVPIPDTGSLGSDLRVLALGIAAFYAEPRNTALIEGVVSAAARSPLAGEVLAEFFADRQARTALIVRRAIERGEVPIDTDPRDVIEALGAPFYYRMLISRRPIDAGVAERAAAAALLAAEAGVFGVRRPFA